MPPSFNSATTDIVVVFTDGTSGRWNLRESPALLEENVIDLCHLLFHEYARSNDDAAFAAAREALG